MTKSKIGLWLGVIAIVMVGIMFGDVVKEKVSEMMGLTFQAAPQPGQPSDGQQQFGFASATVRTNVEDAATGSAAFVRGFLVDSDLKTPRGANDVALSSAGASLSTSAPTSFTGKLIVGNDDFATGTSDYGSDVYYKVVDVSYSGGTYDVPKFFVCNETTPTWTGLDNGAVEATTNITVGTSTVDTTSLQIQTGSNGCLGNPDFPRPLAIAFNTSNSANSGDYDEVRPINYDKQITTPSFMNSWGLIDNPYLLPFGALRDTPADPTGTTLEEFKIRIDPGSSDVGASASATYSGAQDIYAMLLDKTWCPPVEGRPWEPCWGLERTAAADTDIGLQTNTNAKLIAVT